VARDDLNTNVDDDDVPPWERGKSDKSEWVVPRFEYLEGNGTPPRPTIYRPDDPEVGTSPLAKQLEEDGTFDRLSLRQQVDRRDEEDRAQRDSSKALLGDWQTLDDKGKTDWIKDEKDYTQKAEGYWQWLHDNVTAPSQKRLQEEGRAPTDEDTFLHRKVKEQIAWHRQRRSDAWQMEMGIKEAPKYGTARSVIEGTARGVVDGVVANTLKGMAYAGAAIEGLGSITGYDWRAPDDKSPLTGYDAKPLGKVEERGLYKAGQDVSDWANARFPEDKARANEFKTQFAQGLGSMIGFMGPSAAFSVARFGMQRAGMSLLPDIIATVANPAVVSGGTGALTQVGSMGDDALKAFKEGKTVDGVPVDENSILAATLLGVPIGASEALPIAHLFEGHKGQWIKRILIQAYEEGGQEFGQQIAENVTARFNYDDKRRWDDSAWDGLAIGGVLGAKSQIILRGNIT
jgi:hypothetical protein